MAGSIGRMTPWTTAALGLATGVACTSVAAEAAAQTFSSERRIDQMQPASATSAFTRAEGPSKSFDEGIAFGFRVTADYALAPLTATDLASGLETKTVEHALLVHVGGAIQPLDWLNLELSWPFAVFETGEGNAVVNGQIVEPGSAGVGDVRIGAHVLPVNGEAFDMSLGVRFWAPTGQPEAYLSGEDRFFRLEAVLAAAGEASAALWGCTLGIAPLFFAGRDGDRAALSCAAHVKVAPLVTLGVEPHVALFSYAANAPGLGEPDNKNTPGLGGDNTVTVQFEPMAAARFRIGDFSIGLAGGAGIGNAPGTAQARGLLTLGYAMLGEVAAPVTGPKDSDLDGIADEYDACPNAAGTKELRGCPEARDIDGDGIIEGDACPNEAGAQYDDPKANGCPDSDNDRLADPVDTCPREPAETDDGCPGFARLRDGDFAIEPPMVFAGRSATLEGTSTDALAEVINTTRANDDIKKLRVVIGTKGGARSLGEARAKAIMAVFSERDFPQSRWDVILSAEKPAGEVTITVTK